MAYSTIDIRMLAAGKVRWHKCNGVFYSKGGKGIENNPLVLRKTTDNYKLRKVKGKMPYKGIIREKGKSEINALL